RTHPKSRSVPQMTTAQWSSAGQSEVGTGETGPMSELWTANWDVPRPFVHPVRTPAGAVLSVDAPDDHPWHHALWSTIKYVNGENFWEEYDEFGLLHTTEVHEQADP